MAQEIELKLDAAAVQLDRLKRATWLKRYACGAPRLEELISVYYDTDDLALRRHRVVLRIRRIGDQIVQTFKAEDSRSGTGLERLEWECQLERPTLELKHAHKNQTGGFDLKKYARSLKPVFETRVKRCAIPLLYQGSELELAIDRGEIRTGRRRMPIHELEIELKHGKPDDVIAMGREIAQKLRATYGTATKAERGYALRGNEMGSPHRARDLILFKDATAGDAFKVIAMSCLRHFTANRDAVLGGVPEGVHQMRVGLRRLRAALSLFKEMLRGPETTAVNSQLKWLTEELGPARDMEVLVDEAISPMAAKSPVPVAIEVFQKDVERQRDVGMARAQRAVRSERYRKLVLETVLWINGGRWTTTKAALISSRRALPIRRFAAREFNRRTRSTLKKLSRVEKLNPSQRHKLRIAIKKLRYATDFFQSLFQREKNSLKRFSLVLEDLQSSLGQLNDIRVHGELAKVYAVPKHRRRGAVSDAFAMGELAGEESAKSRSLLKTTKRLGKRLENCRLFWDSI